MKDIEDAIENRKVIQFIYKGIIRTVQPHAMGIMVSGLTGLRGLQMEDSVGTWRLFIVERIKYMQVMNDMFKPAADYQADDSAFKETIKQI